VPSRRLPASFRPFISHASLRCHCPARHLAQPPARPLQRPARRALGRAGEPAPDPALHRRGGGSSRSEEHTSELQSLMRISYAVFCLKKKNTTHHSKHKKP